MPHEFDVYIAYAGPDARTARRLYDALIRLDCRAFFDNTSLEPHDDYDDRLPEAQRRSRFTLALYSRHSSDPGRRWYRDETRLGRDLERRNRDAHQLLPIYVDGRPRDSLDRLAAAPTRHGYDLKKEGGISGVAAKLADRVRAARSSLPSPEQVQAYREAMHLDRIAQWNALHALCEDDRSRVFLLLGQHMQNVSIFLDRVRHHLPQGLNPAHRVVPVPTPPSSFRASADDWGAALAGALAGPHPTAQVNAREVLARALDRQPLFLVLGEEPQVGPHEAHAGLIEFLGSWIPARIPARPPFPLRALVATEYESSRDDPPAPGFRALEPALAGKGIHFFELPECEFPKWGEVDPYLARIHPDLTTRERGSLKEPFETFRGHGNPSFLGLVQFLEYRVRLFRAARKIPTGS